MRNPWAYATAILISEIGDLFVTRSITAHNNHDNEEEKRVLMKLIEKYQQHQKALQVHLEKMAP